MKVQRSSCHKAGWELGIGWHKSRESRVFLVNISRCPGITSAFDRYESESGRGINRMGSSRFRIPEEMLLLFE